MAAGSEFDEAFYGVGARRIRQLFEEARRLAPCIIFIDEIDTVGSHRTYLHGPNVSLNQLLVELDGFSSHDKIIVIAATNLPEMLDEALTRPGTLTLFSIWIPHFYSRTRSI